MKKISGLIIIVAVLFSACRYEDGPFMSFITPEKRLEGLWEVEKLTVDEIDYTGFYNIDSVYLRFSFTKYDDEMFLSLVEDQRISVHYATSKIHWNAKKDKIRFQLSSQPVYRERTQPLFDLVPALIIDNQWSLTKLKKTEFSMSCQYNEITYHFDFRQEQDY